MRKKSKEPPIPSERRATVRREIMDALKVRPLTAKEISAEVRVSEKEVYEHLEHIQKSANRKEYRFAVTPAECKRCGFAFTKRERLKKPGKCPVCKSESVYEPLFSIEISGESG